MLRYGVQWNAWYVGFWFHFSKYDYAFGVNIGPFFFYIDRITVPDDTSELV